VLHEHTTSGAALSAYARRLSSTAPQRVESAVRRFRKRWLVMGSIMLLVVVAGLLYSPGLFVYYWKVRLSYLVRQLPAAPSLAAGQRLLVIAPHPDDETLGCAGSIFQALAAGATVDVVWLTSGDAFEREEEVLARTTHPTAEEMLGLGRRRMVEARAAAVRLGLAPEQMHFLGYPDGGLLHLYVDHFHQPYTSPHTGVSSVPYTGVATPGAPYTGLQLEQDLQGLLDRLHPDVVLVPAPQDHHKDHRAAAYFMQRCIGQRPRPPRLEYYIVHGGVEWPLPKGLHTTLPLAPAPRARRLRWALVPLTKQQELAKLRALREYRTQLTLMGEYLLAFVRRNELLTEDFAVE
jgi:LmbE family N-acetylglucosaminyl deacetylase